MTFSGNLEAEVVIKVVAQLQTAGGIWELDEAGGLSSAVAIQHSYLTNLVGTLPKLLDCDKPREEHSLWSWSSVVATTLACGAIERCVTIIKAQQAMATCGDGHVQAQLSTDSLLGENLLLAPTQRLEDFWSRLGQRTLVNQGKNVSAYRLRHTLQNSMHEMIDQVLPSPNRKASYKIPMRAKPKRQTYTPQGLIRTRATPSKDSSMDCKRDGNRVANQLEVDVAITTIPALQCAEGNWELDDAGDLASALGLKMEDVSKTIEILPKLPDVKIPESEPSLQPWWPLLATSLAQGAIQRCVCIIAARPAPDVTLENKENDDGGNPHVDPRTRAALLAEAASPLGPNVLRAATKWIERFWEIYHARQIEGIWRHGSLKKVRMVFEDHVRKHIDLILPKPVGRTESIARRKAGGESINKKSTAFVSCPSAAPSLERQSSADILRQWLQQPAVPVMPARLPWKDAQSLFHIGGGTGGVALVQLPQGVVCLKPQKMSAVAEYMAVLLASSFNLRVATMRIVPYSGAPSSEFQQIKGTLRTCLAVIQEHGHTVRHYFGRTEFLGVLEFVPGQSLQGVETHNLLKSLPGETLHGIWRDVGRLLAFDALINNLDRVPLLWDNDGNTGNLMLVTSASSSPAPSQAALIGVDQAIGIIRAGPGRDRYLNRLRRLVIAALRGRWDEEEIGQNGEEDRDHARKDVPAFTTRAATTHRRAGAVVADTWTPSVGLARSQLAFTVSVGLEADATSLLEGLRDGFADISFRYQSGLLASDVESSADVVARVFGTASVDVGLDQLDEMSSFVRATAAAVAECVCAASG
eukprot:TRINITY_DN7282_c0_g1_i1.p1 TRINITY_DN7282_c0_g1~~TRINITY_DN7282_c0_g1_i1.p1  ORF type:complete len:811 (-),score=111.24 TRINITY_DN7282_c0_g1_i1:51-2483(-)